MPVPKRKTSKRRRDQRSANKGIRPHIVAQCQTCQAPVVAHSICQECGYYRGVKVLRTKTERAHARGQAREAARIAQMAARGTSDAAATDGSSEQQ